MITAIVSHSSCVWAYKETKIRNTTGNAKNPITTQLDALETGCNNLPLVAKVLETRGCDYLQIARQTSRCQKLPLSEIPEAWVKAMATENEADNSLLSLFEQ